jgi:hypothetical protein
MNSLIEKLRQITDWATIPDGFYGAVILSDYSQNAAKLFSAFIKGLDNHPKPWLQAALKDKEWYKK